MLKDMARMLLSSEPFKPESFVFETSMITKTSHQRTDTLRLLRSLAAAIALVAGLCVQASAQSSTASMPKAVAVAPKSLTRSVSTFDKLNKNASKPASLEGLEARSERTIARIQRHTVQARCVRVQGTRMPTN